MHGAKLVANWDPAHGRQPGMRRTARRWDDRGGGDRGTTLGRRRRHPAQCRRESNRGAKAWTTGSVARGTCGRDLDFRQHERRAAQGHAQFAIGRTDLPTTTSRADPHEAALAGPGAPFESGAIFDLDPIRLATEPTLPLPAQAAGELLRGLSCHKLHGRLALEGDCLGLDFLDARAMRECRGLHGSVKWHGLVRSGMARVGAVIRGDGRPDAGFPADPGILGRGIRSGRSSGKNRSRSRNWRRYEPASIYSQ